MLCDGFEGYVSTYRTLHPYPFSVKPYHLSPAIYILYPLTRIYVLSH